MQSKRFTVIKDNVLHSTTPRKLLAVILGNLILGIGCAGLKLSLQGNDPFTAANMAYSDGFGVGLGNFQLGVNLVLLVIQLIWGYRYMGLGSVVNMCGLGYFVQFFSVVINALIGDGTGHGMVYCLVYMFISLLIVAFGLSMYQTADLGVAPYDYLAMGLNAHFRKPYFLFRVMCDTCCVLLIVAAVAVGFIGWGQSHLGIGTICVAFCLGPFVSLFSTINRKWIR